MESQHKNHDRQRDLDRRERDRREIDRYRYKDRGRDRYRERSRRHHHSCSLHSSYRRYNKLYNSYKNRSHRPRYSNSSLILVIINLIVVTITNIH